MMPALLNAARRRQLAWLIANGIAQAGGALTSAWLVHSLFAQLRHHDTFQFGSTMLSAAGIALSAVVVAWLRVKERALAEVMGQDYVAEVRLALFDCLSAVSLRALARHSRGGTLLRFIGDLKTIKRWVSLGIARLAVGSVSLGVAILALAWLNGWMALAALAALLVGAATAFLLGKYVDASVREARKQQARLAANVNEKISQITVVRAFDRGASERQRVARQGDRLKNAMVDQARSLAWLRAIGDVTSGFALAGVLSAGAWQIAAGEATVATVMAAMTAVGILLPSFRDLGLVYGYWKSARVSNERVVAFLATPALVREVADAKDLDGVKGRLEFRDARIEGSLSGFSATAAAGQVTAIVGPNGAGKSTLLALAARLLDPDAGSVLLDGQDLATASLRSLRRHVALVSPDLPLLRGTVKHNLRYRSPDASEEEYQRVIRECQVDEILEVLPKGELTRVTEAGTNLSQGQRARIALARALLDRPSVLLLDETDANLDPRSALILDGILERYAGTILIVTHRLERAARADTIWMFEDGKLAESGPSQTLLSGDGPTARFFHGAVTPWRQPSVQEA